MNQQPTVVQKFWERVFNEPESAALSVRNAHIGVEVYPVHVPGYASTVVVSGPEYRPMSARNAGYAVSIIAAYLRSQGLKRGTNGEPGDRVAIMAWNCPEWVLFDLAVQSLGGVSVPIYPNNGTDQVNYVLEDSGARWLFSNDAEQLKKATVSGCQKVLFDDLPGMVSAKASESKLPFIEHFLDELTLEQDSDLLRAATEQVMQFQLAAIQQPCCGVASDDLATLIYTSGSTGQPKGVELTHDNFAAACESMLAHGIEVSAEADSYLSYLPLAHVYERAGGASLCLWTGIPMAFEGNVKNVRNVLPLIRPTLFHAVPAVWRGVQDNILANAKGFKGKMLNWALGLDRSATPFRWWIADMLVFSKIRNALGGRIRIGTSGGAPLSKESVEFFRKAGIEILQGYGLTETTGAVTVNRPTGTLPGVCNKAGTVGPVIDGDGTQIRIAPIDGQPVGGEIQINGRKVMRGYWKRPEETKKTFTEDGWFRSGDLGHFDDDGFLVITGRLKRLLKTDGGKYVAPDKIEKAFEGNPIVQYVVPVGDGKPFISGLIFVNAPVAVGLISDAGIRLDGGVDVPAFLARQQVVLDAVKKAVDNANSKLEHWETLKKYTIIPVEATVEGGLLTPTQKIRTEEALKRFASDVEAFYKK